MVKSMVNSCLPEFSDFTRVFSPVKVLCNRPQDNAPAHKSVNAMDAVHDCGFELVDHPPSSPNLAPSDYFLFNNMWKHLVGKQYRTDDIISAVEGFFEDPWQNFDNNIEIRTYVALNNIWLRNTSAKKDQKENTGDRKACQEWQQKLQQRKRKRRNTCHVHFVCMSIVKQEVLLLKFCSIYFFFHEKGMTQLANM